MKHILFRCVMKHALLEGCYETRFVGGVVKHALFRGVVSMLCLVVL